MKVTPNSIQFSGNAYSHVLLLCKPVSFTAGKYGQLHIHHIAVYVITQVTVYLCVYCTFCTFMICCVLATAWSLPIEMCSVPVRYNT